jgi:hypothetical protein
VKALSAALPSSALAPRNLKFRRRLHTVITSHFRRPIAAVISLESTDVTDKWAAKLDCVPRGVASRHEREPIACGSSGHGGSGYGGYVTVMRVVSC